jgi:flagellar biosynthesis/type III secretory pathway M-ring protein FliF/YscJ
MEKFLHFIFIVLLIYFIFVVIFRFVIPFFLKLFVKRMQRKFDSQFQGQPKQEKKKLGKTYVDYIPENNNYKENSENIGEYVDFEEIE